MDFLPHPFYDHLASHLEDSDLFKISFKLSACTLTKVSQVHYEKRQKVTLSAVQTEGEWFFSYGKEPNRTLADLTRYEYVKRVVFTYKRHSFRYRDSFFWKDSLEKILGILPRYLRRADIMWYRHVAIDKSNTKLWDIFFASGLSRAPFSSITMPYVDHRSVEFLRRQISFRGLEKLDISATSPPSVWDCIEELLRQLQLSYVSITDMCAVSSHMVEALIQKRSSSKFGFSIKGKKHPDLDLEQWSNDPCARDKEEIQRYGDRCLSFVYVHPMTKAETRFYSDDLYVSISPFTAPPKWRSDYP
uniref:F-box domain-containing protein n=1 Tax=Steinernema glaseri TaxID=37863 RepID=A0A1I7Z1C5_9BILA